MGTGGQQLQRPAMMMPTVSTMGAVGGLTGVAAGTSPGSMVNSAQAGAAAATAILAGRTGTADPSSLAGLLSTGQTAVLTPEQQQMQQQLLQQQQQMANNRVYIGNVPFGFSSEDLKKIFVVFGPILSCQLLPSQENPQQHRGYGFIEYATADAAKLAIETMNGFEVAGKQLKVNFATAMRNSPVVGTPLASTLLPTMGGLPGASPATAGLVPGLSPAGALGATAVGGLTGLTPGVPTPAAPGGLMGAAASPAATGAVAGTPAPPAVNGTSESAGADGGKERQGEKEDEDLPPAPAAADIHSRVVLLTNMVTPSEVDGELKDEVRDECSKFGGIKRVEVHTLKDTVRIFVEFSDLSGAREAIPSLHGRWFGGRQIIANTYDEELFHQGEYEA